MNKTFGSIKFLLKQFGPLVAFYSVNLFFGLKAGIGAGILVTLYEIVQLRRRKEKPTTIFIYSAIMTIGFGALDLYMKEAYFFKFEACITNLMTAVLFGSSLIHGKPIIQEFAESQGNIDREQSPDRTFFFRLLTFVWTLQFVVKAFVYLWVNFHYSLEEGLIIRMVLGKLSIMAFVFLTIATARPLWRILLRLKIMPSTRHATGAKRLK